MPLGPLAFDSITGGGGLTSTASSGAGTGDFGSSGPTVSFGEFAPGKGMPAWALPAALVGVAIAVALVLRNVQ